MFIDDNDSIKDLLITLLGTPKRDDDQQLQFNCPNCAKNKGGESDGKFNLECNLEKGYFHCWACQDPLYVSGKISRLFSLYGNEYLLSKYYNIINELREQNLYNFDFSDTILDDIDTANSIELPDGFTTINEYTFQYNKNAVDYLFSRGLTLEIIKKYNIGAVNYFGDQKYKNRIIIPSYDKFGLLNYYIGRDYTDKNRYKYINPKVNKTEFMFNEYYVNYYETITLVEGTFDHIVVPNSIALLGKDLKYDYYIYNELVERARSNINIWLDSDAEENSHKIYDLLNNSVLKGRVFIINTKEKDPSSIFQNEGSMGIIKALGSSHYKI